VRTGVTCSIVIAAAAVACASVPTAGPLEEGTARPRITAVDTMRPPRSAWIELDRPGYVALILVAPSHSATLLYPADSLTNNSLSAGTHQVDFQVPDLLVQTDSMRFPGRGRAGRQQPDSAIRNPGGVRSPSRGTGMSQLALTTQAYLLLLTSPQPLDRKRIIEKTAGVSIPSVELEALNAAAKAVKSTIQGEPREISGYYQRIELRRPK